MLFFNHLAFTQVFTPEIYDEDCPVVAGRFFIRVYLVYVQTESNQWATALGTTELQRRSRRSMEMLNAAYNPSQIYFVAGTPSGLSGDCYTVYTGEGYPAYDNGITIQIESDDYGTTPTGHPSSTDLPNTAFFVGGNENGVPASLTPVLIHEMGHCLGLAHPFAQLDGRCDEMIKNCDDQTISPPDPDYYCNCCGDMVCDTDYNNFETDFGVLQVTSNCCCSTAPSTGISPDIFRNYMSWSVPVRCHDRFTPGQVRRMRCYLDRADESVLKEVLITPETISGSVTWTTAQSKSGVIEVPSGATLTVNAQLTMSPGSYIFVRRGGVLVVNATITTACGGMWGGVVVEGTAGAPQKQNGQYSTAQGRLSLNATGIIEHAVTGVALHGFGAEDDDYTGGILEARGQIINCTNGVRFGHYRDGEVRNASFFIGAKITLTDDYRGPDGVQPRLLYLYKINELQAVATLFRDLRTEDCTGRESRAEGLVAEDADFLIKLSYFRNLDRGIIAATLPGGGGYGAYEVKSSYFYNCYTGIYSALPDAFSIFANYFLVFRPEACPKESANVPFRGVHLAGYDLPEGILLSENVFEAGDGEEDEFFIGTDCLGAGIVENFISKNNYEDLTYGNRAAGNNGGATGLRYECNENTGNTLADFYVRSGGTVRTIQGDKNSEGVTTAAGNKFIGSLYSWRNFGSNSITYFYNASDPEQDPAGTNTSIEGDVDAVAAFQPNPNCDSGGGECPPPCDETQVDAWKSQFSQQKSAWLTKTAILPTLSGSAAEDLVVEISAHRSAMDTIGGKIIREFALDSTGVKRDSLLAWTDSLHRYEADLRLARHHFFSGNFTAYEQWLSDIETRNDLSTPQVDELAEFEAMLAVVKPSLQGGVRLHRLSAAVLDSLELWASDCTEPGFIAKEILRRNGRKIASECETDPEERPLVGQSQQSIRTSIGLYPNPATDYVYLEAKVPDLPLQIKIVSLDGRALLDRVLPAPGPIDVSNLPPGLYLCRFTTRSDLFFYQKLIISR